MNRTKNFYQACGDGDTETIDLCIKKGQNVDEPNPLDGYTGLHYAADRVNSEAVRHLITAHKADVNRTGPDGATALHWACRSAGGEDTIEQLLLHGADPNIQGQFGRTPLHVCARKGFAGNLRTLVNIRKGKELIVDLNKTDNVAKEGVGTTALHLAAAHNHTDCVRALLFELDEKANCSKLNSKQQTALHLACGVADVRIVRMLIDTAGPGVKELAAVDKEGRTPLLHACQYKNAAVVDYLVKEAKKCINFNLNFQNTKGETALHYAASGGNGKVLEILLTSGTDKSLTTVSGMSPLHVACQQGQLEAVTTLINNGVDIDAKDELGETPFFKAVHSNSKEVVEFLTENGAIVMGHNSMGETPTHIAVKSNAVEVLEYLMKLLDERENKIEDDIDNGQNSPLHIAAQLGHYTCSSCLIKNGYRMGRPNKSGYAPVHLAAKEGRKKILELMMSRNKGCVGIENKKGNTPLHLAAKAGFTFSCRVLINGGGNEMINKGNLDGATALHFAAECGSKKICQELLAAGADVFVQDVNDNTPLHYCAQRGEEGTAKMLIEAGADIAAFNEFRDNPLLTAIKHNNENVLAVILGCDRWRDAIRVKPVETMRKKSRVVSATDVLIKVEGEENNLTCKPLHMLIIHYPEQARTIFDRCTSADDMISEEDAKYWVEFDYSLIENPAEHPVHPFHTMLEHNRIELLDHPLVLSLITHKWELYGRTSYYMNVFLNFLFVAFLTVFALVETPPDLTGESRPHTLLMIMGTLVILIAVFRLVLEVLQALRNTVNYFSDPLNYFEVFTFIFSIVFVVSSYSDSVPSNFQWEVGCFVSVLAWLNFIFSLTKLPYVGLTIIMTRSVLSKCVSVMFPVLLFILPFAIGLYMTLGGKFGTFKSFPFSYSKAMVMLTGEINYDMYYTILTDRNDSLPLDFPYSTFVVFHMFLFGMTIMLSNLLVGLAVDDVSETLRKAKLLRSAGRIDQIFLTEKLREEYQGKNHPEGRIYPNRKKGLFSFWRNYSFTGEAVEEVLSRNRQDKTTDSKKLHRIQREVAKLRESELTVNNQLFYLKHMVEEIHSNMGLAMGTDSKISLAEIQKAVDRE